MSNEFTPESERQRLQYLVSFSPAVPQEFSGKFEWPQDKFIFKEIDPSQIDPYWHKHFWPNLNLKTGLWFILIWCFDSSWQWMVNKKKVQIMQWWRIITFRKKRITAWPMSGKYWARGYTNQASEYLPLCITENACSNKLLHVLYCIYRDSWNQNCLATSSPTLNFPDAFSTMS